MPDLLDEPPIRYSTTDESSAIYVLKCTDEWWFLLMDGVGYVISNTEFTRICEFYGNQQNSGKKFRTQAEWKLDSDLRLDYDPIDQTYWAGRYGMSFGQMRKQVLEFIRKNDHEAS